MYLTSCQFQINVVHLMFERMIKLLLHLGLITIVMPPYEHEIFDEVNDDVNGAPSKSSASKFRMVEEWSGGLLPERTSAYVLRVRCKSWTGKRKFKI